MQCRRVPAAAGVGVVLYMENNRGSWCVLGHVEGGGKHRLVIAYMPTYRSGTESIIHRGASHGNGKGVPTQEGLNDKRYV